MVLIKGTWKGLNMGILKEGYIDPIYALGGKLLWKGSKKFHRKNFSNNKQSYSSPQPELGNISV